MGRIRARGLGSGFSRHISWGGVSRIGDGAGPTHRVDEARPGRYVGEIRDPEPVGRGRVELPVHLIQRTRCRPVAYRRAHRFTADRALKAQIPHQPLDRAAGDGELLKSHLPPDLAHAVNTEILGEDAQNLGPERFVAASPCRTPGWIAAPSEMLVIGRSARSVSSREGIFGRNGRRLERGVNRLSRSGSSMALDKTLSGDRSLPGDCGWAESDDGVLAEARWRPGGWLGGRPSGSQVA